MASRYLEEYSQTWMRIWVEAASGALSVDDACRAAGVSLADYCQGRLNDLAFDRAAQVFDEVMDLKILSSVRTKAVDGDLQAQALYYGKARLPAFVPAFPSWQAPAPSTRTEPAAEADPAPAADPQVVEAMVTAGLGTDAAATKARVPRRRGGAGTKPRRGGSKPPAPR